MRAQKLVFFVDGRTQRHFLQTHDKRKLDQERLANQLKRRSSMLIFELETQEKILKSDLLKMPLLDIIDNRRNLTVFI